MRKFQNGDGEQTVPQLLAGILAAVSYEKSDTSGSSIQEKGLMHPHPVQVLALFRLLGVDQVQDEEQRSWLAIGWEAVKKLIVDNPRAISSESHLIEIKTG